MYRYILTTMIVMFLLPVSGASAFGPVGFPTVASIDTEPDVTMEISALGPDQEAWQQTAVLTNNGTEALTFAAYLSGEGPLTTTMNWETFTPTGEWQSQVLGFCGTGLTTHTLESGASVELHVPTLEEPGEYRYSLPIQIEGQEDAHHVRSESFTVAAR